MVLATIVLLLLLAGIAAIACGVARIARGQRRSTSDNPVIGLLVGLAGFSLVVLGIGIVAFALVMMYVLIAFCTF